MPKICRTQDGEAGPRLRCRSFLSSSSRSASHPVIRVARAQQITAGSEGQAERALFMNASAAIVDSPLRTSLAAGGAASRQAGSPLGLGKGRILVPRGGWVRSETCCRSASVHRGCAWKTPPSHRLDGVHKRGAHYSSRRGPRVATARFRDEPP
jgi:hypothetical protein